MRAKKTAGFTLFELMMTITVLGVLLGIGVPSFTDAIRNNRTAAQANELVTAFAVARSEASRRGMPVAICAASDATQTACAAVTQNSWANGWIVFTDINGTAGSVDAGDQILQTWPAINSALTLTSGNTGFVRFGANGAPIPATSTTFDLQHSSCTGANHRRLQLNIIGRVQLTKQACT